MASNLYYQAGGVTYSVPLLTSKPTTPALEIQDGATTKYCALIPSNGSSKLHVQSGGSIYDVVGIGYAWRKLTLPASAQWTSIAYGNGIYVCVGYGTTFMYSTDGETWHTTTTGIPNLNWISVSYGSGKFVAVNANSGSTTYITSTDGITWATYTNLPSIGTASKIYWSSLLSYFLVAGTAGNFALSADGLTWSSGGDPYGAPFGGISSNSYEFILPLYNYYYSTLIPIPYTSVNHSTYPTSPTLDPWNFILRGSVGYIIIATSGKYLTTVSGISPYSAASTLPLTNNYYYGDFGAGVYVLSAVNSNILLVTSDLVNFSQVPLLAAGGNAIICFGNNKFVGIRTNTTELFVSP